MAPLSAAVPAVAASKQLSHDIREEEEDENVREWLFPNFGVDGIIENKKFNNHNDSIMMFFFFLRPVDLNQAKRWIRNASLRGRKRKRRKERRKEMKRRSQKPRRPRRRRRRRACRMG